MRRRREEKEAENTSSVTVTSNESTVDISTIMLKAGVNFAKRNKKFTGAYLIGLLVLLFATGFSVTSEQQQLYSDAMNKLDSESELLVSLRSAKKRYFEFDHIYRQSKGWFNCNRECELALRKRNWAKVELDKIKAEILLVESNAKSHLGVFSEHSVSEARNLFWETFAGGKDFAQRSSWFDLLFLGFDSMGRDEHLVAFLLRFMFQVVMNFTLGVIGAFFGFIYYLGAVVNSYQPSFLGGWSFYLLAILGAFSLVTTFLVALYFSAAGTAFVAVKAVGVQALLESSERRRRVQYRRY